MTTQEENIQVEVKSSYSKLDSSLPHQAVPHPSADFADFHVDNSKLHDETTVSLAVVFLYTAIGFMTRKPKSKGI